MSRESAGAPIGALAPETLLRIFAHLDPRSLTHAGGTCRLWRELVSRDTTWRAAFGHAFGLDERAARIAAAEGQGHADARALRVAPALRRVDAHSWRAEYAARTALLRRWRRSRTPCVFSDPRIAPIDILAVSARRAAVAVSRASGVAARANAFTGKITKGLIDAAGPGAPPPLPAEPPRASAVAADAPAARIVWGHASGDVSTTLLDARHGAAGAVRHMRLTPRAHSTHVTQIALPHAAGRGGAHSAAHSEDAHRTQLSLAGTAAGSFATAAADGSVAIWLGARRLWTASAASATPDAAHDPYITALDYSAVLGIVAAARRDGAIVLWRVAVRAAAAGPAAGRPPAAQRTEIPALGGASAVATLVLDTATPTCTTLLAHHVGARVFLRHDVHTHGRRTTVFGAPGISPLTVLRTDFSARTPLILPPTAATPAARRDARFAERKFVCAGTHNGGIGVWEWDAPGEPWSADAQHAWQGASALPGDAQVRPAHVFAGHPAPVSALEITPALVLAGFADGTIRALCALTGAAVRTFNERTQTRQTARTLAADTFRVRALVADADSLVAAVGTQLLAWRTHAASARPQPPPAAARTRRRAPDAKARLAADLERAVQDSNAELAAERAERAEHAEWQRTLADDYAAGLPEDDALAYALMLSRDEAADAAAEAAAEAAAVTDSLRDDLPADLVYMHDDDADADDADDAGDADNDLLATDDGDLDAQPVAASPPLAPLAPLVPHPAAPAAAPAPPQAMSTPSRAWDIVHHAGRRASATGEQAGSWTKLRTVAVPASARAATSPGSSASAAGTPLQLESAIEWPDMPLGRSPARAARSPSAWDQPSPQLRAADAGAGSALVRSPPAATPVGAAAAAGATAPAAATPALADDDVDDDMRLALALSLAEYEAQQR